MACSYYYFIASLPHLMFGQRPHMTVESYLAHCHEQLAPLDAAAVCAAVHEEGQVAFGAAKAWREMRHALKNELAAERALRAGKDPAHYLRGERTSDLKIRQVAQEVLAALDPLDAQRALDRRLWEFLADIETGHFFDGDNAVIYGLRLQILQRYEDITSARGPEIFAAYLKDDRLAAVHAAVGKK